MAKRFLRRRLSLFGLVVLVLILALAALAPLFGDPAASEFAAVLSPPSGSHLLGTDDLGRDTLTRIAYGARVSMEAGVLATLLAMAVGVPLGLIAGYYRGWPDLIISRLTDLLLAFPFLILAVGLAAILGPSLRNVVFALGISALPSFIRVTRGEVLGLREQDYVAGAIADGAGDARILRRYILPNAISPLLVQATVTIPEAIIGESVLSFLGLGVQPPTPSWGTMLSAAQSFLGQAPLLAVFPGLAIALAALSFNLVGDGLRDTLDPKATR
ncbi:MAG: ABC transporter permease [Actinomycetota bacterium]|nr:ABC transporter permease [Actinomycetota bacterium]